MTNFIQTEYQSSLQQTLITTGLENSTDKADWKAKKVIGFYSTLPKDTFQLNHQISHLHIFSCYFMANQNSPCHQNVSPHLKDP